MSHDQTEGPGMSFRGRRSLQVRVSQGFIYQRRPGPSGFHIPEAAWQEDTNHLFRKVIRPVIQQSSVLTNSRYYSAIYLTPDNYAKPGLLKSKKSKTITIFTKTTIYTNLCALNKICINPLNSFRITHLLYVLNSPHQSV